MLYARREELLDEFMGSMHAVGDASFNCERVLSDLDVRQATSELRRCALLLHEYCWLRSEGTALIYVSVFVLPEACSTCMS